MHNARTLSWLTKAKVLLPPLTHSSPSPCTLWIQHLAYFGIPYLCPLNPCNSRPSEGNHQAIKDNFCRLRVLILVSNTSSGDTYATTSCCLICAEVEIRIRYWAVILPSTLDFEWLFWEYARSCLTPKKI